ncbi:MAG: IclR family transcriptional regulator [Pseudomonadota bacterium]
MTAVAKAGPGTAQRVTTLLTHLADAGGPVTIRQMSDGLGLAPSTTHRLLNLLVEEGFVSHDDRSATYAAGPEFLRVAHRIVAATSPADAAHGVIADLAARYDETVLFGLLLRPAGRIAFVARADGQKKLLYRIEMNTPLSLVWGASGKAALAHMPQQEITGILAREGASPASGAAVPDAAALDAELARIRADGYGISHGEKLPEALGIAAPVFGPGGVIGSICMTMPNDRAPALPPERLGAEVAQAAADFSARLGGQTP